MSNPSLAFRKTARRLPRFFWRRALAFLLDCTIADWRTFAILAALPLPNRIDAGSTPQLAVTTRCQQTAAGSAIETGHPPERTTATVTCVTQSPLSAPSHAKTTLFDVVQTPGFRSSKSLSYPVDANGAFQPRLAPLTLLTFAVTIPGSRLLGRRGLRSPGKTLAGLRITGVSLPEATAPDAAAPTPQHALSPPPRFMRREVLRLLPLLLLSLLALPSSQIPPAKLARITDGTASAPFSRSF